MQTNAAHPRHRWRIRDTRLHNVKGVTGGDPRLLERDQTATRGRGVGH